MPDAKLTLDPETNQYDINFVNGDLEMIDSFDTALIISLFTDARADVSEVVTPQLQRGWWGDTLNTDPVLNIGSKFWLLAQARQNAVILNKLNDFGRACLAWLLTYNYSKKIDVRTKLIAGGQQIDLTITNVNSETQSKSYKLWQNTGL